jgi:Protein of unknown function (DUF2510)
MTTPNQPGWYDDSDDPNALRYWDGKDWTPLRQPKPALPSAHASAVSAPHRQPLAPDVPPPGAAPTQDAPPPDASAAPAGWYPDPSGKSKDAYWDGQQWDRYPTFTAGAELAPVPDTQPAVGHTESAVRHTQSAGGPPQQPTLPPAGWYPDPTGKPVQKYWDGEAWTDIPPPEIPATREATRPPVTTTGPSGQRQVGFVLAGLVALAIALQGLGELAASHFLMPTSTVLASSVIVLIILIIGVTIAVRSGQSRARIGVFVIAMIAGLFAVPNVIHLAGRTSPSPSSPDSQPPQSASSAYYKKGYQSGKSGLARRNYGVDKGNMADHPDELEHDTCSEAADSEVTGVDFLEPKNQDDFMSGCLQAFNDSPPTGGPKPGPFNPYR